MNNPYTIGLIGFDDIDFNVMAQIIDMHHSKIMCIQGDAGDIVFHINDLPPSPRRVGQILDMIDHHLFQSAYQDIEPFKDYILDWKESLLYVAGREIVLTDRERDVMAELIMAGEKGCRRDYLLNKIWDYRADLDTHAVETHIYRLRQKIEDVPELPKRLLTIESGYRLN